MKLTFTYILLVFTFFSAIAQQNIQNPIVDSLAQSKIIEKIDAERNATIFSFWRIFEDSTIINSSSKKLTPEQLIRAKQKYNSLNDLLAINQQNHKLHCQTGVLALTCGYNSNALRNFDSAVKLSPDTPLYYYGRAVANTKLKRRIEAITDFKKVIKLKATLSMPYDFLASLNYDLIRYKSALYHCNKALELRPDTPRYYHRRAVINLKLYDEEAAIDDLKTVKELDSDYAERTDVDYTLQCLLNKIEDSGANYYSSVNAASGSPAYFSNRGDLKRDAKRHKEAIIDYEKALVIDSTFSQAYYGIGMTYNLTEEYENAIIYIKTAITLDENFAKAYYSLGEIYLIIEKYNEAVTAFDSAVTKQEYFPTAYFKRGLAKEQLDQIESAERDLSQALKQRPYYPEAKKKLKKLRKKL